MTAYTRPASTQFDLHQAAETAARVLLRRPSRVTRVTSHLSPYSSSFRIEEVAASLESGEVLHLVRKDLAWERMLPGARRIRRRHDHDPHIELNVYRHLLPLAPAGPPLLLAADDLGGSWFMLERIAGEQLRHVGDVSAWEAAAQWTGAFHAEFTSTRRIDAARDLGCSRWEASRLQHTFVAAAREIPRRASGRVAAAAIRAIKRVHPRVVQRLAAQVPTVIHGQLYPSNVMVSSAAGVRRIAVLDWETTAIGAGVIDLAALVEGQWTAEQRRALVVAYLLGRDGAAHARIVQRTAIDLACARLHLCLELFLLPVEFDPPIDHAADWLDIAVGLCRRGRVVIGNRYVIVNADDLGLSAGINQGIADAYDHGIVTSASLMVLQPAAEAAAVWAQTRPRLSLGIHLDLCEWEYRNGEWILVYERAHLDEPAAVATEIGRQLDRFREIAGGSPTHIDCHQHVHRSEPAGTIIATEAAARRLPLRDHSRACYAGGFYGQTNHGAPLPDLISANALIDLITSLPAGWSEVACHAGYAEDATTSYRDERRREVEALCSPAVRRAMAEAGINLRTFRDLPCT